MSKSTLGKRLTKSLDSVLESPAAKTKVDSDLVQAPKQSAQAATRPRRIEHPQPARLLREVYPSWRPAAESALRLAGVPLNRPMLRELTRTARTWLEGRQVSKLDEASQAELTATLRARLLHLSPAVTPALLHAARRRGQLLRKMREPPIVELLTTSVEGGTWIQVIPTNRPDIVLGEAFAPYAAGAKVPTTRPAIPGIEKLQWIDDAGRRLSKPPPLPDAPRHASSGLLPGALEQVPEILQGILRRAELRRLGLSTLTLSGAPIRGLANLPAHLRTAFGGGIRSVEYRVIGSRIKYKFRGRTRIPIVRMGDEDALPSPAEVFGKKTTMQRLHAWGSIFGDSIAAGIAYGSQRLNQAMLKMEKIMRVRGLTRNPSIELVVDEIVEMRKIDGVDRPHLIRATYSWTDEGTTYTFSVGLDEAGEVYGPVPGLGEPPEEIRPQAAGSSP